MEPVEPYSSRVHSEALLGNFSLSLIPVEIYPKFFEDFSPRDIIHSQLVSREWKQLLSFDNLFEIFRVPAKNGNYSGKRIISWLYRCQKPKDKYDLKASILLNSEMGRDFGCPQASIYQYRLFSSRQKEKPDHITSALAALWLKKAIKNKSIKGIRIQISILMDSLLKTGKKKKPSLCKTIVSHYEDLVELNDDQSRMDFADFIFKYKAYLEELYNDAKALSLLMQAGENNYLPAILKLLSKKELSKEQKVYWITKAAHLDHIDSILELGKIYFDGNGTEKSLDLAEQWWRKAAEMGNTSGMEMLAKAYQNGENDLMPDLNKAIECYETAFLSNI